MTGSDAIRVLVADDEAPIRDAYRQLLAPRGNSEVEQLRRKLFGPAGTDRSAPLEEYAIQLADNAEDAVNTCREAIRNDTRFDVIFLDMRMPPGRDGAWAAAEIRKLDPAVHIVIATAYSDLDPAELSRRIPPAERLFYLQKPFHAHEVRQMALALGSKARAESRIHQLAYFDHLTRLPNRALMRERFARDVSRSRGAQSGPAVVFVDLDNFKRINDTLGHAAGDAVLQESARRLLEVTRSAGTVLRDSDHLARVGGDEFALIVPGPVAAADLAPLVASLIRAIEEPMRFEGHELYLSASAGIARFPEDGEDLEVLLKNADLAMYFAKRSGRGQVRRFEAEMNARALKRLTIEAQLRRAIDRRELSLLYQPQLAIRSGRMSGVEALLRWNHPALGQVPPLEFIPVAEECGLIGVIGDWALCSACAQAAAWRKASVPIDRVAVNLSPGQLLQPQLVETVALALRDSRLPAGMLELELTETALIADLDRARHALESLKELGVTIAIDDFGVGYSGMTYLRDLPVDRIKIDRSFIIGIGRNGRNRDVAAAIVSIARSMNLKVIAEGVEDAEQLAVLEAEGCDEAQGFYLAGPMTAADAERYSRQNRLAERAAG